MTKAVKWYKPEIHTGWDKDMTPRGRRIKSLRAHGRDLLATARSLQALSNVNSGKKGDKQTYLRAKADAKYFFKKYEESK